MKKRIALASVLLAGGAWLVPLSRCTAGAEPSGGAAGSAVRERTGIVTVGVLNVRAKPGLRYEVIAQLHRGTRVTVVAVQDDWLSIRVPPDSQAWIAARFVRAGGVVTGDRVRVRSGAGLVFTPYALLAKGSRVHCLGAPHDGWQRIAPPADAVGWVHRRFVKLLPAAVPEKSKKTLTPGKPGKTKKTATAGPPARRPGPKTGGTASARRPKSGGNGSKSAGHAGAESVSAGPAPAKKRTLSAAAAASPPRPPGRAVQKPPARPRNRGETGKPAAKPAPVPATGRKSKAGTPGKPAPAGRSGPAGAGKKTPRPAGKKKTGNKPAASPGAGTAQVVPSKIAETQPAAKGPGAAANKQERSKPRKPAETGGASKKTAKAAAKSGKKSASPGKARQTPEKSGPVRVQLEGTLLPLDITKRSRFATHILCRAGGGVLVPFCYLICTSGEIDLDQWKYQKVRIYGREVHYKGWTRPTVDVDGIQLLHP